MQETCENCKQSTKSKRSDRLMMYEDMLESAKEDKKEREKAEREKQKKKEKMKLAKNKKKQTAGNCYEYGSAYERYLIQNDKLNLSGLLNALDGLLELHDVIIVLTTNHPEKLDPALIRHGRITHTLEMTYITNEELRNMAKYHFPEAPESEVLRLEIPRGASITPATIENMCLKSGNISEFADLLNERDKTIKI